MLTAVQTHSRLKRYILLLVGLVWATGIGVGTRSLLNYETAPAIPGAPPANWPKESHVPRTPGLPTLLVLGHPHCPCTRATVGELALIMARLQGRVTATVIFIKPKDTSEDWEQTDLWHSAAAIPGVKVMSDAGGVETDLFQALASGQTMLYSADGRLLFSGGITASRGHSGDNAGRASIVSLVTTGSSERNHTPVYGCYLHSKTITIKDAQ